MSTFSWKETICAVCDGVSTVQVINSTNEFGSPDLDLRPAPMRRSTMPFWVQECPHCGYVAPRIDIPPAFDREFLTSPAYLDTDGLVLENKLTRRFYRQYLCAMETGAPVTAFHALLHAAWCCDDDGSADLAVRFRSRAAELMDERNKDFTGGDRETYQVLRADLLRRSRQFDRLIREYGEFPCDNEIHAKIIAFQLKRAAMEDAKCYTVAYAVDHGTD